VACSGSVPHWTATTGVCGRQAASHQAVCDLAAVGGAHQDDDRAPGLRERLPIGAPAAGGGVDRTGMAGDHGEGGYEAAVGDRYPCVRRHGDRRSDPRHYLERDPP
jgi:hypothetical protein